MLKRQNVLLRCLVQATILGCILFMSTHAVPVNAGFADVVVGDGKPSPGICEDEGTAVGFFKLTEDMGMPINMDVQVVLPEDMPECLAISHFGDFYDEGCWDLVSEAGFYIVPLRSSMMANRIIDVDAHNVQCSFDAETKEISVSFDYVEPGAYCGYKGAYFFKLIVNHNPWINDGNVRYALNPDTREIVVEPLVTLDRIDVHATSLGRSFNKALTLEEDGTYRWSIAPNVMPGEELSVFFNYNVAGVGHDTPTKTYSLENIEAAFQTKLARVALETPKAITVNPNVDYRTYYIHYSINGGAVMHYEANDIYGFGNRVYKGVYINANPGDVVSWYLTILEDGVSYDTQTFEAIYTE